MAISRRALLHLLETVDVLAGGGGLDGGWTSPLPGRPRLAQCARGGGRGDLLSHPAGAGQLRAARVEREPAPRLSGDARVLRRIPDDPGMIAGPLALVAAIALATAGVDGALAIPLRHIYLMPADWTAMRYNSLEAGWVGAIDGRHLGLYLYI